MAQLKKSGYPTRLQSAYAIATTLHAAHWTKLPERVKQQPKAALHSK